MANRQRGEVTFEANGETWTMKIGTNAMCEIEEATGKSISEVGKLLGNEKTASMSLMRAVFWGSLQEHHDGITLKQAAGLIDEIGAGEAGALIGKAFEAAFPKQKEGSARPQIATAA